MFAGEKFRPPPAEERRPAPLRLPSLSNGIDLRALGERIGRPHRMEPPELADSPAVLEGSFSIARLREGFFLHSTNILHLHDMTSRAPSIRAGVKVLLKLEGNAEVRFGGTPLRLDAGQGAQAAPCGAIVTLTRPEDFERRSRAGTRERMVVITLTAEWFAATGLDAGRFAPHLSIRDWQPSPRAVGIAEQLVRPASFAGPTHALYQESRALELVAEALAGADNHPRESPSGLRPADYQRICRLQRLLDSGAADCLDMAAIAQAMCCNPNTLQQQFRQAFGQTIFDYLRERRLQRAAAELQRNGISVARAAEIAGYSNQANFSTAFRRRFGVAPKQVRLKI